MSKRTYDQFCPAARALEVIGERWTLLIVRELLIGQKRYTDLLTGLPGIGPNVLAGKLKELQTAGIVQQTELAPPAASTVYELTDLGRELEPVLVELFKWGANFLGEPRPTDRFQAGWLPGTMRGMFQPDAASGLRETYEFRVDDVVFHIRIDDGTMEVGQGSPSDPDLVVTTDLETFLAVGSRRLSSRDALAGGGVEIEGEPATFTRMTELFSPEVLRPERA